MEHQNNLIRGGLMSKEPIMQFYIDDIYKTYTIYEVDKIEGKDTYIGETQYDKGIVLIEKGSKQQMIDTLGHELAHIWLYENGHPYQAGGCFTYEQVCELISFSNNSIYNIIQAYKKKKGWL